MDGPLRSVDGIQLGLQAEEFGVHQIVQFRPAFVPDSFVLHKLVESTTGNVVFGSSSEFVELQDLGGTLHDGVARADRSGPDPETLAPTGSQPDDAPWTWLSVSRSVELVHAMTLVLAFRHGTDWGVSSRAQKGGSPSPATWPIGLGAPAVL